jgi:hypothetical protein
MLVWLALSYEETIFCFIIPSLCHPRARAEAAAILGTEGHLMRYPDYERQPEAINTHWR